MKNALRALGLFGTVTALALPAIPGHASTADQILISDVKVNEASLPCSGTATARWDRSENVLEVNSALTRRDMTAECEAKVTVNWLFNERVVATVDRPLPAVRACTDDEACDSTVYDVWRKRVGAPDNTVPDSVKTQAEDISVQLTVKPQESAEDPAEDTDAAKDPAKDPAKDTAGESADDAAQKAEDMAGEMAGDMAGHMAGYEQDSQPRTEDGSEDGSEDCAQGAAKPGTEGAPEEYPLDSAQLQNMENMENIPSTESTDCGSVPPELLGEMSGTLAWE